MVLKLNEFRDKLAGCWAGKNVGGVLGAPFECKRMVPDVDFYIQDLSMGPPAMMTWIFRLYGWQQLSATAEM